MNIPVLETPKKPTRVDDVTDSVIVRRILNKHNGKRGALISVLEDIQNEYGYLPESAMRLTADEMGVSLVDLYGVATFYRSFSLKPRGRHVISVCLGTACHVRGAPMVVQEFERQLGIRAGDTTPDMEFTLETVNCLGACALGPIVTVDGRYFSNVSPISAKKILKAVKRELPEKEQPLTGTFE